MHKVMSLFHRQEEEQSAHQEFLIQKLDCIKLAILIFRFLFSGLFLLE